MFGRKKTDQGQQDQTLLAKKIEAYAKENAYKVEQLQAMSKEQLIKQVLLRDALKAERSQQINPAMKAFISKSPQMAEYIKNKTGLSPEAAIKRVETNRQKLAAGTVKQQSALTPKMR